MYQEFIEQSYSVKVSNLFKSFNSDLSVNKKLEYLGVKFNLFRFNLYYTISIILLITMFYYIFHLYLINLNIMINIHEILIISIGFTASCIITYYKLKRETKLKIIKQEQLRLWNLRFPIIKLTKHEKNVVKEILNNKENKDSNYEYLFLTKM